MRWHLHTTGAAIIEAAAVAAKEYRICEQAEAATARARGWAAAAASAAAQQQQP